MSVAATASQPERSLSAGFELQGSGEQGELRLSSPLGSLMAVARWSADAAVLSTGEGQTRYPGLDELSRRALGEVMPLAALPDWLSGRPWSGAPHQVAEGGFQQLGWDVVTARFAEGRVDARRAAEPEVRVRVRLDLPG
jgi:outer membrane lipoprotein LolB